MNICNHMHKWLFRLHIVSGFWLGNMRSEWKTEPKLQWSLRKQTGTEFKVNQTQKQEIPREAGCHFGGWIRRTGGAATPKWNKNQSEVHLSSWCFLWGTNCAGVGWELQFTGSDAQAATSSESQRKTVSQGKRGDQEGGLGMLWLHGKCPSAGAHREQSTTRSKSKTTAKITQQHHCPKWSQIY